MVALDKVQKKVQSIKKLYNDVSEYFEAISLKKTNIASPIDIDQEMKEIYTILNNKLLQPTIMNYNESINPKKESLSVSFEIYHLINLATHKIDNIINELGLIATNPRLTADMSDNAIKSVGDLFNNITLIYNKYQQSVTQLDIDMIHDLTKDLKLCDTTVEESHTLIKKYPFALALFAYIMQQSLDKRPDLMCVIQQKIEDVKDFILLHGVQPSKSTSKNVHKINPHMKTFGLTPIGPVKKLSELSKDAFPNSTEVLSLSKLGSIAKSKNICIVILNRIIKKPIEFRVWNLINWKYAKEFLNNPQLSSGISENIIKRFDTISFIQTDDSKSKDQWDFDVSHYGDINSEHFVIFENLGVGLFRLLSLYSDSNAIPKTFIKGGGNLDTRIARGKISEFIEYIGNKGVGNNHTRINTYHDIHEKEMLKNMFLPVKFNIDGINLNSQIVDSALLRNELSRQLSKRCYELIEKDYKNSEKIKTHKDIGQIIHDKKLSDIFNSVIISQYDSYAFKNKETDSGFPFSELLKTFLAHLQLLNRDFVRNMHDNFINTRIDIKIFEDSIRNKNIYMRKLCDDVIAQTLTKLVSNESNVYQGLIYKTNLLRLSVV